MTSERITCINVGRCLTYLFCVALGTIVGLVWELCK